MKTSENETRQPPGGKPEELPFVAPCRDLPGVADVRVMGALGVVELREPPDTEALRAAFIERGVWIRPLGRVVYLAPALTIAPGQLSRLTGAIEVGWPTDRLQSITRRE